MALDQEIGDLQGVATGGGAPVAGRGATYNPAPRFDPYEWDVPLPGRIGTQVSEEPVRRVISENRSPDLGFDRSINPYRGCEHGCVYC